MLDIVRAWLNGTREFYSGVMLYEKLEYNPKLLALFKSNGKTDWCYKKLQNELLIICNDLKSKVSREDIRIEEIKEKAIDQVKNSKPKPQITNTPNLPANPELYAICKKEADLLYKQIMSQRSILFADIKGDAFINTNTPDKVEARGKMAIEIVKSYQKVSELYDKADHVFKHGCLPDESTQDSSADKYSLLPNELVKTTLDNLRKNYNKKKKLDPTPERIASLQEHEENIKKLEARWHSLKPTQ